MREHCAYEGDDLHLALGAAMFERFTDRARRVLVLAQDEARLLDHNFIGTEHILLGLVHEGEGVAAKALGSLGISLEAVRQKVEETVGSAGMWTTASPPFTPAAKKVLELSLREALQLGHNYIGTEHMLLGIVREGEGGAASVLVSLGADLPRVRREVVKLLSGYQGSGSEKAISLRCGRCGASVSSSARYRTLEARPGEEEKGQALLRATTLYCGECGTMIGPPVSPMTTSLVPPLAVTVHLHPAPSGTAEPPPRFPEELLRPVRLEEVPEEARVELIYRDNEEIEGTVAGKAVRVNGQLGPRGGPVRGTWGGVAVSWRLGDKLGTPAGWAPGIIRGRVGDDPLRLDGVFLLGPRYLLEEADIAGDLCGHSFRAKVSTADGGIGATSTVVAEGNLGEQPFELFASLSDDFARALVRGSLGGHAVWLDATSEEPSAVRVVGGYSGPLPLLALIVNVLVHFL
jgi:hypothetical protein